MRGLSILCGIVLGTGLLITTAMAQQSPTTDMDVIFALDNSGSMKQNDPHRLMSELVTKFAAALKQGDRVAVVVFDKDARNVLPLTPIGNTGFSAKLAAALAKINYGGRWTDIPAAFERSLYEFSARHREEAQQILILITDGYIDLGSPSQDAERKRWLNNRLLPEAVAAKMRVFGIALTEDADYELIQGISQATDGRYFRVLSADDIAPAFERILTRLAELRAPPPSQTRPNSEQPAPPQPVTTPSTVVRTPLPSDQPASAEAPAAQPIPETAQSRSERPGPAQPPIAPPLPAAIPAAVTPAPAMPAALPEIPVRRYVSIAVVTATGMIGIVLIVVLLLRRRGSPDMAKLPGAQLFAVGATGPASYRFKDRVTRIGQLAGMNEIVIPQPTISKVHATIEYHDNQFFLRDERSTNGTFLNGQRVSPGEPRHPLKHGDTVRFDAYDFRFSIDDLEGLAATQRAGVGAPQSKETVRRRADGGIPEAANEALARPRGNGRDGFPKARLVHSPLSVEPAPTIHQRECVDHPGMAPVGLCVACGQMMCRMESPVEQPNSQWICGARHGGKDCPRLQAGVQASS